MRRLDKSFQAFFRRVKACPACSTELKGRRDGEKAGYPRFKGQDRFNSFTYPSVGDGARIIGNKLRLQHVGWVRINLHRPIEGEIKTISVKREGDKWYLIAACQLPDVAPADVSDKPITGIDVAHGGQWRPRTYDTTTQESVA